MRSMKIALAVSSCLVLAGCATTWTAPKNAGFDIPGPPAYLSPVKVPMGTADTDARELAIQRRHALEEANGRISRGKAAWLKMQKGVARR